MHVGSLKKGHGDRRALFSFSRNCQRSDVGRANEARKLRASGAFMRCVKLHGETCGRMLKAATSSAFNRQVYMSRVLQN